MEYKEIVSVTGMPGLYQLLSSKSDGAIVRTLDGETTRFVATRTHNFTPLESIEVFTTEDNVPLFDVFKAMQEKEDSHPVADVKDDKAIKAYFQEVFPTLDEAQVYMSDMKKMLKWYPLLKSNDLLNFEEEPTEPEKEEKVEKEEESEPSATRTPTKKETDKKEKAGQTKSATLKAKKTKQAATDQEEETEAKESKPKTDKQ